MSGNLTLDELTADVAAGRIDTVIVAMTDMAGQLVGKRFHARYFLDSGAAVHVIALRSATSTTGTPPDLLRQLADQTRGQYVTIYTPASLSIALDSLADRLATEVMIDYLVPADSAPHDVRIGIRIPGARVRGLGVSK